MRYNNLLGLEEEKFRRLTGIKRATFEKMVWILKEADQKKKIKGGRKNKLSLEDQLLITLEYIVNFQPVSSRNEEPMCTN